MIAREVMIHGHKFRVTLTDLLTEAVVHEWKRGNGKWSNHWFWGAPVSGVEKKAAISQVRQYFADKETRMAFHPGWPLAHDYETPEFHEIMWGDRS